MAKTRSNGDDVRNCNILNQESTASSQARPSNLWSREYGLPRAERWECELSESSVLVIEDEENLV